jgi:hypothetical protein
MVTDTSSSLAFEARHRVTAGIAAILAGLLTLAGPILTSLDFAHRPVATWLSALDRLTQSGNINQQPSLRIASFQFFDDHKASVLANGALRMVGLLAMIWAIVYLSRAVSARKEGFPTQIVPFLNIKIPFNWLKVCIFGLVLEAIATMAYGIGSVMAVEDFLNGPRTVEAATNLGNSSFLQVSALVAQLANLPVAIGFVMIALNAMRTGLLTRFMGVLGIIIGVLFFIPIASNPPVIQTFWLVALGFLFFGFWPKGVPPAWKSGKAEPWPARQPPQRGRQRPTGSDDVIEGEVAEDSSQAARGRQNQGSKKRGSSRGQRRRNNPNNMQETGTGL